MQKNYFVGKTEIKGNVACLRSAGKKSDDSLGGFLIWISLDYMVEECDEDNIIFSLILIIHAKHIFFLKKWDNIHVEAVILTAMLWWSFVRD